MRASFVLSGVWEGIRRNLSMTIALILSTSILLTFVATAILANREIDKFGQAYEGKLNVSVYLCTEQSRTPCKGQTTAAQQSALQSKLEADPIVADVIFVTQKQNYERARETSPRNIRDFIEEGSLPASFTVKLKDLNRDYEKFRSTYAETEGVSSITNQISTIRTLLDIISSLQTGSIVVAIVILIASVLLIANTIQVAASQRKNETSIMRLVGASRWMTELPFILEAVVATVIGGLVSFGMVGIGKYFLLNNVFGAQVESGVIPNLQTNDVLVAGGVSLIGGILLAAVTAFATLRLYVKL